MERMINVTKALHFLTGYTPFDTMPLCAAAERMFYARLLR